MRRCWYSLDQASALPPLHPQYPVQLRLSDHTPMTCQDDKHDHIDLYASHAPRRKLHGPRLQMCSRDYDLPCCDLMWCLKGTMTGKIGPIEQETQIWGLGWCEPASRPRCFFEAFISKNTGVKNLRVGQMFAKNNTYGTILPSNRIKILTREILHTVTSLASLG